MEEQKRKKPTYIHVGSREVGPLQIGAAQISVRQIAAAEVSHLEVDVAKIKSGQIGTTEVKALQNTRATLAECSFWIASERRNLFS